MSSNVKNVPSSEASITSGEHFLNVSLRTFYHCNPNIGKRSRTCSLKKQENVLRLLKNVSSCEASLTSGERSSSVVIKEHWMFHGRTFSNMFSFNRFCLFVFRHFGFFVTLDKSGGILRTFWSFSNFKSFRVSSFSTFWLILLNSGEFLFNYPQILSHFRKISSQFWCFVWF